MTQNTKTLLGNYFFKFTYEIHFDVSIVLENRLSLKKLYINMVSISFLYDNNLELDKPSRRAFVSYWVPTIHESHRALYVVDGYEHLVKLRIF